MKSAKRFIRCTLLLTALGCTNGEPEETSQPSVDQAPIPEALPSLPDGEISISELRRKLGAGENARFQKVGGRIIAADLYQSGVTEITPLKGLPLEQLDLTGLPISDLTPLRGMPLVELRLEGTNVTDITPLSGLPLQVLWLNQCPVEDLSPLRQMKLVQLNLNGTKVKDLTAVNQFPLGTLWLPNTPVTDLLPLKDMPLESLDIENTDVSDLSPIAGNVSLKRLNIAGTKVTDLTPLKGMRLERLVFDAEKITTGLQAIQLMPSLRALGPSLERTQPPQQFWLEFYENSSETSGEEAISVPDA